MDPCSIGKNLHQENDCHNTNFTNGKKGILAVTDLGKEQVELLKLRTELEDVDTLSICLHHKKMFLERYTKLQTVCCNPFGFHTGKLPRKSLRPLTIEAASKLSEKTKKNFKPGQKMCPSCAKVSKDFRANEEGEMSDPDVETGDDPEKLNKSFEMLNAPLIQEGYSPLKLHGVGLRDRPSYGKRKLLEVKDAVTTQMKKVVKVNVPSTSLKDLECSSGKNLFSLLREVNDKMNDSTTKEKIKYLSLAPQSWTNLY